MPRGQGQKSANAIFQRKPFSIKENEARTKSFEEKEQALAEQKRLILFNQPTRVEDGDQYWEDENGKLHRDGAPAVIYDGGSEEWWQHGIQYRPDGGPCSINLEDGEKEWNNKNGILHRENGPARVYDDGSEEYYKDGKLHRVGGPAINHKDGSEAWWVNGQCHRDDGPAVISSAGRKIYYKLGSFHREDGPAVIHPDGKVSYALNGEHLEKEEWAKITGNKP